MKVPVSWLKEYVDIEISLDELADRLTMAGNEVESIDRTGLFKNKSVPSRRASLHGGPLYLPIFEAS